METFSVLLAICAWNSPVTGEFHTQRPGTQSFDVYFELRPNKRLSKQLWGWWFETPSHPLWRHRNDSELWRYLRGSPKYAFEETVEGPVKWDALMLIWCHLNALWFFLSKIAVCTPPWSVLYSYSISQEICTRFCCALLCCGYAIIHNEFTWSIYPYSLGLLCWHWGNR